MRVIRFMLTVLVGMLLVASRPVAAETVLDMPAPPKAESEQMTATSGADASGSAVEGEYEPDDGADVGELALYRYAYARTGAYDVTPPAVPYPGYPSYYGYAYYPYSFYGYGYGYSYPRFWWYPHHRFFGFRHIHFGFRH